MAEPATVAPEVPSGEPIRAQSADGVTHEFPFGTAPEIVDKAMKAYAQEHADKTTTLGQIGRGMADPLVGAAQLAAHAGSEPPAFASDEPPNQAAQFADEFVRQREASVSQERGINASRPDWSRMIGNLLSPANYIGGGLVRGAGAGIASTIGRGVSFGAAAGALEPVTSKDFASEKTKQIGLGSAIGGVFGLAGAGASKAVEQVGKYLARNHPEALENKAVQIILRRMGQDVKYGGPKAKDAIKLINESSKPLTLADVNVSGPNVRGLAGNVARAPGPSQALAKQFLNARDEAAAARLEQDIADHVHSGPSAYRTTETLLRARSAAATPLYDDVRTLEHIWSPRLQEFLEHPLLQKGLQHGYRLESEDALAEGRKLSTTTLGIDLDIDGNIKLVDKPNMRLLDMAKRGLDKMVADERNEITGRLTADGRSLEKVRKAFVDEIDGLDTKGIYKKAREAWSGPSASMDAVRFGKTLLSSRRTEEEVTDAVGRLSPNDKEFARLGLADDMRLRLGGSGLSGDEAKQLINTKNIRDRMRPLFKTREDYDDFIKDVFDENAMFETRRAHLGGSQSQERLAEEAAGAQWSNLGHITHQVMTGHPFRAAITTWKMYRDLGLKPNPELNEKIAQILFTDEIKVRSRIGRKLRGTLSTETPNPAQRLSRGISQGVPVGGASATATMRPPQENPAGGNQIPQLAEGGIVTEPTLAMVGEAGPEAVVPLDDPAAAQQVADKARAAQPTGALPIQPSNFLADADPAMQAQQAREVAAQRQLQAVKPAGGRQESEFTQALLDAFIPGRGVIRALGQGEYGQAAEQAGMQAAPFAGKALGAASQAMPMLTKAVAASTAALTSLFMDTSEGASKLSPEDQSRIRMLQEKSKLEQQNRAKEAEQRKKEADEKAERDAKAAQVAAQTQADLQARLAQIEADKQREQARIEEEHKAAEQRAAEETIRANAAENKRLAERPFREKHPDAALGMFMGGIAAASILPGATQAYKQWAFNTYLKDWEKLDQTAAKTLLTGSREEQQLAVNRLSAAAAQLAEREGKLEKYPWLLQLGAPAIAVEMSMLPAEIDIAQPVGTKAHESAIEYYTNPATLGSLGAVGAGGFGLGHYSREAAELLPKRKIPTGTEGTIKTFEERNTAEALAAEAAAKKKADAAAKRKATLEAKKKAEAKEEPRKAKVPRGGPKIYGLREE